jgi:hypothetical protein
MKPNQNAAVAAMLVISLLLAACDQIFVREPSAGDLAGVYHLTPETRTFLKHDKGYPAIPDSTVELRSDGSLVIRDLPDCALDGFGKAGGRFLSGRGTWRINKEYIGYGLWWTIQPGDSLPAGAMGGIAIRRRSPPYELEIIVGDPDTDERLRYQRTTPSA